MFWNKWILQKPKEITLVNRLIDLCDMDWTEVVLKENNFIKEFNYPFTWNPSECTYISIRYNKVKICVSYVKEMYPHNRYYFIVNWENWIQITEKEFNGIKNAVSKIIEQDMLKSLYPFKSPELENIFNDVRKIQDWKEQIEFITNEIEKIKDNYN